MSSIPLSSSRFLGLSPWAATILVIIVATAFRFFYSVWLPILPDESYYLQWSRHLDASYYSKGPAVAYTIAAGAALFGGHNLGIRFFAVLLSAGTAWQIFLLARRWYDETTALIAVLITGVVPIYALGAVVMTIDPLSAFFWIWAAHLFSRAVQEERLTDWLLCGFAVGSGFLAKYINAVELLSFMVFLLCVPARRALLAKRGFWLMLAVAVLCTTPVFWWNWQHGWVSGSQLWARGHMDTPGPFRITISTFLDFLALQALVISPWLFLGLLLSVIITVRRRFRRRDGALNEGELLLFILFVPVWLMYALLSWHMRGEPNWPAISYLSLIIIMAAHWRKMLLAGKTAQPFIIIAFVFAWLQTVLMHDTQVLSLPGKIDPMSRFVGWKEISTRLNELRAREQADVLIADGYKEASIFSFYLPDQAFIHTLPHETKTNQYDFWPTYPKDPPHRALWITGEDSTVALQHDFNTITFLEKEFVLFHGKELREYDVYRCENR